MSWRKKLAGKLVTPEDAVSVVKAGDTVGVAPFTLTPHTLCGALAARRNELRDVRIEHAASIFPWAQPEGGDDSLRLRSIYATPVDRAAHNAGAADYLPFAAWKTYEGPAGFTTSPDVYMVPVSPPDAHGYCSFGSGVWMSGTMCANATKVIAEVHEDFIRTGGENHVHMSQIDLFCEPRQATGNAPIAPRTEEETMVTEVICTLVANELTRDGDTIQIGIGTVSSALALYLGNRRELGIQTELITGGVTDLVEQGVVTGEHKTIHRGKVVASACVALEPRELQYMDGHPAFELYDFGYTDDLRRLIHIPNFVAVNNALQIDLSGQIAAESLGHQIYTGVGGQTVFMIAGAYSEGGRSISVTPSSSLVNGQRVSRIVPELPPGSVVTVPRTLVDYVVTEYGIATMRGKTLKERTQELINVAHPEFREELCAAAKRLNRL